jgi:carbon monoxide dehydrogenase subunit G
MRMSFAPALSHAFLAVLRRGGAVLLAACLATGATAQDKGPVRSFNIVQKDESYVANVVMFAAANPAVAWTVLTDFENMAKWVPNVKESTVKSRDGNTLVIEQQGTARFGILSIPYTSVRRMQLEPKTSILSTQTQGSMKRLVSLMKLSPEGTGTRLDYQLELVPSGLAATVMSKEFLQREITDQFTAIVGEMDRRAKP